MWVRPCGCWWTGRTPTEYVGKTLRVLVDGENADGKHTLTARTDGGRLVHLDGDKALVGTWQQAKITGSSNWALFGELV